MARYTMRSKKAVVTLDDKLGFVATSAVDNPSDDAIQLAERLGRRLTQHASLITNRGVDQGGPTRAIVRHLAELYGFEIDADAFPEGKQDESNQECRAARVQ
jgi:hypothetical protein